MKNISIQPNNLTNQFNINNSFINYKESLSINYNNQNQKEELDNIIRLIKIETDTNNTKFEEMINIFLRKNQKIKNEAIEKILDFLSKNNIHYKAIIKCLNAILELVIDNFQMINILNNVIPLLLNNLFQEENLKNNDAIRDITNFIGKLIKIGNTHIFGLVEEIMDSIFHNIFKENIRETNLAYPYIYLLSQIMKNSVTISFNNIIVKNNIGNFITLMDQYCSDKNEKLREMSAELTGNFINMFKNRDDITKNSYIMTLYETLFNQYNLNLKLNNVNTYNYCVVNGFLLNIKKIYELYPSLFNDDTLFIQLADSLMKFKNCGKNEQNIKLEFINFIPDLYKMNTRIFKKKYINKYFKFSNESLNREKDNKIKYNLLVVLGKLNYFEQESINKYCSVILRPLITRLLTGKDFMNELVLKSLSDLLNNKAGLLSQSIIQTINIFSILPKIFKTPLNKYKVEFLISLINYFSLYSMENCTIIILSLNTISLIMCNEEFRLDNFLNYNEIKGTSLISSRLAEIKANANKDISKYLNDISYKDKSGSAYLSMISDLLTLFSNIRNSLFYKDMLIFYHYKIIPMMKYYNEEINKQILNIVLSPFVTIDKSGENSSIFIIKNIIDAFINIFILNKDTLPKEELINIFEQKEIFIEILLNEKQAFFQKVLNLIDSSIYNNSKELLIKLISILEKKDKDNKSIYKNFIGNYIGAIIFEIYNTQSIIYEENLITILLYLTSYFNHLFWESLYEKVLNISILLLLKYEYKDFITINVLKILNKLLSNENIKGKNISILNNILYILAVGYFKESNINDYISEFMLNVFYLVIKIENIDISKPICLDIKDFILFHRYINYTDKILEEYYEKLIKIYKKLENIIVTKLIYNHLLKCESEKKSIIILKILGLSMTFSFTDFEKLNLTEEDYSDDTEDKYLLEDDNLKIKIYNKFTHCNMIMNYPSVETSGVKAILSLMEVIKYHNKKDLKIKIILNTSLIIQFIPLNQPYYIDIILPTILRILPQYESKYQNILINNMTLIIKKFREKSKIYIDEIVFLIYDYIQSPYLESVNDLFIVLFEFYEFKIRKYFYRLIPRFISIIKMNIPERISYLKLLILIAKTSFINPYIKLLLENIKSLILSIQDLSLFNILLDFIKEIVEKSDVYIYFPLIISTLLNKMEKSLKKNSLRKISRSDNSIKSLSKNYQYTDTNLTILNKFFDVLDIMNDKYRKYFLLFLPQVINFFIATNLIENIEFRQKLKKYINHEKEYTFMTTEIFKQKIFFAYCKINCYYAFNSFSSLQQNEVINKANIKLSQLNEFEHENNKENSIHDKKQKSSSFYKKELNIDLIKNRRSLVNNDIVIKSFQNSNCSLAKDWIEWYRKVNKSILEQNPSKFIYIFYLITEYYFNMTFDLNLNSFLSLYNNFTDNNKRLIMESLDKAIMNPSTPDYIIISTLNLINFMEKKNIILSFRANDEFGKIAYNCKSYAKALYYKEKGFEEGNELESIDDFIDLYYKLNVTENGIGLIKLFENNPCYEKINNYDKKYIWYINMHDYNKALEIINETLYKTNNEITIKNLKNYRNICLYGLCDWETILSEEEQEFQDKDNNINIIKIDENKENNIHIDKKTENKEKIERKLLLLKSSLALGNWDKLIRYMNELKDLFLNNNEKSYSHFENNIKIKNINSIDISNEKEKNEKSDEYISFNELINKEEFQFLKYNESLFDLNLSSIIIYLKKNNYEIARKYIDNCQKLLINKMKVLINESFTRENDTILKNQCLQQLEHFCNYKQYHSKDKQYFEEMKLKFKLIDKNLNQNPEIYIQHLAVKSLIYPIEEEYYRYIDLSKVYRKSGQFIQAENILKILKKRMNLKDNCFDDKKLILDEKRIKIELCYNKCLFAKGDLDKAVENLKYLIELLKDHSLSSFNKLGNIIKSKIYGNYAIYKMNQLSQSNIRSSISRQKSENINRIYSKQITNYLSKHNFLMFLPKKEDSDKVRKVKFKIEEKNVIKKLVKENDEKGKNDGRNLNDFSTFNDQDNVFIINENLRLATEFNNKSYKYWHYYAMFNYKCCKFIYNYRKQKNELNYKALTKVIKYAINAVNGLKHSLIIANKNKVRALEDCLRFIDIFFELGNKDAKLLSLIESIINETNLEIFMGIIPQLTCRFDIKDQKVLDILINLLSKLLSNYPEILLFPIISIQNSKIKKSKEIASLIMNNAINLNSELKELDKEYEEFVNELNKCSVLYHEEWIEAIETSAKLYLNRDNNMFEQLMKIHKKMKKNPENLYEINFHQLYGSDLKEAEKKLNKYLTKKNINYLKEAWEIYQTVYKNIKENYFTFQTISLKYISSKLFNFSDSNIIIPGFYYSSIYDVKENNLPLKSTNYRQNINSVKIKQINKYLPVLDTKQHPRKITMIGTNNKEYSYLLKGQEDLRQDERVIQIFNLVNLILAKESSLSNLNLFITVYSVIPLSNKSGLIGWVHDCDSLEELIKEFRKIIKKINNVERSTLNKINPKFESSTLLYKVDSFIQVLQRTTDNDLRNMIWLKSKDCESWFTRTTNYSRSLAVMSIVGYILGLGDRHLNNILMNRKTGKIVHINLSDCFEVAMKRDKFPEKVPFRLTRMLVKALGITGVEGIFRLTCEKTIHLLKENRDSLLAILNALIHNPLISFKLLIPLIIGKGYKNRENININLNEKETQIFKDNLKDIKSKKNNLKRFYSLNTNLNLNMIIKNKEESEIKDEKQIMEKEQRQIFNLFEESEDIDAEELYKISQVVMTRINNKLNGNDFYNGAKLNEKEQVDILIKEARSIENLATSYLGWCPFW